MTDYEETEAPQEDWAGFSGAQTDIEDQSLHPATLTGLTRKMLPSSFDPSGRAPAIIWTFALEDMIGQKVDGTTSEATGQKSKARPWIEALMGKAEATQALKGVIDPKALIGRACQVLVAINDNGFPKVTTVLPLPGARRTPAEPQTGPDTTSTPSAAPGPSTEPTDEGSTEPVADSSDPENTSSRCNAFDTGLGRCERETGHPGNHRGKSKETWA
jgi:hypothetical protein